MEIPRSIYTHSEDGMCINGIRVPWLTVDRLGSGRDIRLSTATMRALNSRRPRAARILPLFPRSPLILVVLLLFLHGAQSRSVPREDGEETSTERQVRWKILEEETKQDQSVEKRLSDDVDGAHDGNVAKKRRRNDINLFPKSGTVEEEEEEEEGIGAVKEEGIRRFDAQVDSDKLEEPKETIEDRKRLIDIEVASVKDEVAKNLPSTPTFETLVERDVSVGVSPLIAEPEKNLEKHEESSSNVEHSGNDSDELLLEETRDENAAEELRNDLRSLGSNEGSTISSEETSEESGSTETTDIKDFIVSREHRYLAESEGKSKFKTSTIYLNAEEGKIPDSVQESIVNGQIKKLISIRDDALGSVEGATGNSEQIDDVKLLGSRKSIGIEEDVSTEEEESRENVRGQRSHDTPVVMLLDPVQSEFNNEERAAAPTPLKEDKQDNLLQRLRNQATLLQGQIKNKTFLQYIREHTSEILPEVQFTEKQLLEILRNILSKKTTGFNETYLNEPYLNATKLTDNQLEILRCAEQLVEVRQRQSFVSNVVECIKGLSVFNCMSIFVWPLIVDNLPESITQNIGNLPIEINLFDLFQNSGGNKAKTARASGYQLVRLHTPESIVSSILRQALEWTPTTNEKSIAYIDPKNETLKKLLTPGQIEILQMAEKLLPEGIRREYSDTMFSCVRRFEYFSCVKYFAWPMVRQSLPTLPTFPDYQVWYPTTSLFPNYPILPFPSFSGDVGELPEIEDADATRMRKPKPEAAIVHVLSNVWKEHPRVSTHSALDEKTDSYVALIPHDQLLSIYMAEQLLPVAYRPEFVQKTIRCIREYNYLTCIRYSTWPMVRQFVTGLPSLPDIIGFLPDLQLPGISDVFGYFPDSSSLPDFSGFLPVGGGAVQPPVQTPDPPPVVSPSILFKGGQSLNDQSLDSKIVEILTKIRDLKKSTIELPPLIIGGNAVVLTTITEKQANILRYAESILPPGVRAAFISQVINCLQEQDDFTNCTKYVVWPFLKLYVPNLPDFPQTEDQSQKSTMNLEQSLNIQIQSQDELLIDSMNPDIKITSRTPQEFEAISRAKFQSNSVPLISVTDTRFVPIFTEHPESVILNILKGIQLESPIVNPDAPGVSIKSQQFLDLLSSQQETIIRITESLIPDAVRPEFVNKMIECLRKNNFINCTREIIWPILSQYFPGIPNFPNFGIFSPGNNTSSTSPPTLTEPSTGTNSPPLSETKVNTGQHGDAKVTITDTRFFPIFSEHPEAVILNILRAVQISTPNLPDGPSTIRAQELSTFLTEQQSNIVQIAESLLPQSVRPAFVDRMLACIRQSNFLDCTRDIAWPTIAQFFPRLPNFPNFGSLQNLPRSNFDISLILDPHISLSDDHTKRKTLEDVETEVLDIFKILVSREKISPLNETFLNLTDPTTAALLTNQQVEILNLAQRIMPHSLRRFYLRRVLECIENSNFMTCTELITWPTLRQFYYLPKFPDVTGLLPAVDCPLDHGTTGTTPGTTITTASIITTTTSESSLEEKSKLLGPSPNPGNLQYPRIPLFSPYNNAEAFQGMSPPHRPSSSGQNTPIESTSSVGDQGIVLGYAGQPTQIFLDLSREKINLPDDLENLKENPQVNGNNRKRRSTVELFNSYYDTNDEDRDASTSMNVPFPDVTESEFLSFLVNVSKSRKENSPESTSSGGKKYYVDSLNSTIRGSLSADQYEILKLVEDLNEGPTGRQTLSKIVRCIRSLSFIRCIGIFVWPMISNNLASFVPSLPFSSGWSLPNFIDTYARTEATVQAYFGMSTQEFERKLLARRESMEDFLTYRYKKLMGEKFRTKVGLFEVEGLGDGRLGFSFAGFREGRGTKIKDNKNLPSILTIISDIMEEVLDQRPDVEKVKKDKEKKERSIDDFPDDYQSLKEEYPEVKRSINDDQIITMFLNKLKTNYSEGNDDVRQYTNLEDAYDAFEVLFGTRLNGKFADKLKTFDEDHLRSFTAENTREINKEVNAVPLETQGDTGGNVTPVEVQTLDLEKESLKNQAEDSKLEDPVNFFESFLNKNSEKYLQDIREEMEEDQSDSANKNKIEEKIVRLPDKNTKLTISLPELDEEVVPSKLADELVEVGKSVKTGMMQMMPGIGFIISFFVQLFLSHARAAASIAGLLSNIALGSAMFGMIRQAVFGPNTQPKIKYVYDNDKIGPGITWSQGPYYQEVPEDSW